MLTIRKQNFEEQQCYCCTGTKANFCDPNSSVTYRLTHRLPNPKMHLQAQVIVPRCKHCADKMKPMIPISIIGGLVCGIGGFLYTICAHGVMLSLLIGVVWAVAGAIGMFMILSIAFSVVYNQRESDYEIVNVLRNKYGWSTDEPKEGETDYSFTDSRINGMLEDLVVNYGCEYGNI